MRENPILADIYTSISSKKIELSRYTFLEPISIGHLAIACKENKSLIDPDSCTGNAASFLSRLNFFSYVGLSDPFGCNAYLGNNPNTIEINEASNTNNNVYDKVDKILSNEPRSTIETIERLLAELITNVEMYANFGIVVGQVISRVLHLAIVDKGPGIVSHLRASSSNFVNMSDEQIMIESLKKGVTSGRGKGFGLWQTQEVLSRNKGTFLIRSENQVIDGVTGNYYKAKKSWFGTSVELRYNLDSPVNFDDILVIQNSDGVSNEFGF